MSGGTFRWNVPMNRGHLGMVWVRSLEWGVSTGSFRLRHSYKHKYGSIRASIIASGSEYIIASGSEYIIASGSEYIIASGSEYIIASGSEYIIASGSEYIIASGSEYIIAVVGTRNDNKLHSCTPSRFAEDSPSRHRGIMDTAAAAASWAWPPSRHHGHGRCCGIMGMAAIAASWTRPLLRHHGHGREAA
jgi:hypothetical protein